MQDETIKEENSETIFLGNSYSEFAQLGDNLDENPAARSPHYISTIDQLNDRIANLSCSLDKFYGNDEIYNIVESRDSTEKIEQCDSKSSHNTEKERKDVKQFSGIYSMQTIMHKQWKPNSKITNKKITPDTGVSIKPMLIELHSFPGYDKLELTPLPASMTAEFIMRTVVNAQKYLANKPTFKETLYKFFITKESIAVLQDTFWWFFCQRYQPALESQEKLFDRIATNYTTLLFAKSQEKNHEKLFKNYGVMLAQAIYATFCHAFPNSYRQFNGDFREEILSLCLLWTMGTKAPPRSWEIWNFEALEPFDLRKDERIQEAAAKAKNLDYELRQIEERSRLLLRRNTRRVSRALGIGGGGNIPLKALMEAVQESNNNNNNNNSGDTEENRRKKNDEQQKVVKQISSVLGMTDFSMTEFSNHKKSCEVGPGPTFNKVVFNVYGRSPLVSYYLSSNNLLKDVGTSVLVQRTEIDKLPPLFTVDSETYEDLIEEAKQKSEEGQKKFENLLIDNALERRKFLQKNAADVLNFKSRTAQLLSNPKEVRKISDLLRIPENREPMEESNARAAKLRNLIMQALGEEDDAH